MNKFEINDYVLTVVFMGIAGSLWLVSMLLSYRRDENDADRAHDLNMRRLELGAELPEAEDEEKTDTDGASGES